MILFEYSRERERDLILNSLDVESCNSSICKEFLVKHEEATKMPSPFFIIFGKESLSKVSLQSCINWTIIVQIQ